MFPVLLGNNLIKFKFELDLPSILDLQGLMVSRSLRSVLLYVHNKNIPLVSTILANKQSVKRYESR